MSGRLPDVAYLVALVGLPAMGPVRLGRLLTGRSAEEGWARIVAGGADDDGEVLAQRWRSAAAEVDVGAVWHAHLDAGIAVLVPGAPGWPAALADDPEPPAVLFARGDPAVVERPAVAIVGTRRCTHSGRSVARELGSDLAAAGVCVVSGLAAGIDAAAHAGALAVQGAPPAAVVGTGLDVVYPRPNRPLWDAVAERGVVLSEYPLGTRPDKWRFPARNRIVAGLSHAVVVVESREAGGSMHTVEAALERDRTVLAVPGPVRSDASTGTNALLAAGCPPARDVADVLVALGLEAGRRRAASSRPDAPLPKGPAGAVLDAVGWEPVTLEQIADRLGEPLGPVAVHLLVLERDGWVAQRAGWYERAR